MKKLLTLILAATVLSANAHEISMKVYSQLFKNFEGCFILFNLNEHKIVSEYNPNNRCNQRIPPNSTFKMPLSLMAFNQGIINQNTIFKWNGKKRWLPEWNQDLNPNSWLKYSALWVSRQITLQLGYARIKHYLAGFAYGNQDFSGDPGKNNGLTSAWVSSSLKISAVEQLHFINAMLSNELPITSEAVTNTSANLYLGKLNNGFDFYGKTGSGEQNNLRSGWFVGFIENKNQHYTLLAI